MKLEGPRVAAGLLSKDETVAHRNNFLSLQPRKEYRLGKIKLDFKHTFSDGATFEATEDGGGTANIVLRKGGRVIVDFARFLPGDFGLHTPTYFNSLSFVPKQGVDAIPGRWKSWTREKMVSVGDLRQPREIFSLLHEIGHGNQTLEWAQEVDKKLPGIKNANHAEVRALSVVERDAWSRAIRIARQIKEESGVNLFEVFKTEEEFHEFLYSALLGHKRKGRFILARKSMFQYRLSTLLGLDTKDGKFIDGLFDKGRLRRGDSAGQKGQGGEALKA